MAKKSTLAELQEQIKTLKAQIATTNAKTVILESAVLKAVINGQTYEVPFSTLDYESKDGSKGTIIGVATDKTSRETGKPYLQAFKQAVTPRGLAYLILKSPDVKLVK